MEKNKVYLIMLDSIFIKSIDYVENEYGKWKYSYNPTLLTSAKEKYKSAIDFSKACTLIKYVGNDTFEELYTNGEYKIYLSSNCYEEDSKYLFLLSDDIKKLDELDQKIFYELGNQNPKTISGYIKTLYSVSKNDHEEKKKEQFNIDYTSAIGKNLYYDFMKKRTRE